MARHIELTLWRKKQIAMLYHFASLDYLKGLLALVNELAMVSDGALSGAQRERRDDLLIDERWGMRNTAENWGNYGWPLLLDFKRSLLTDIAKRSSEIYSISGTNQFARGTSELSLQWASISEEKDIDERIRAISHYASPLDETMRRTSKAGRWSDFGMARVWREQVSNFSRIPKLRLHVEVEGKTGHVPPRTGAYVPQDDTHGIPQFAWCGDERGKLQECKTFNSLGLEALNAVGRRDLWFDDSKMYAFATLPKYRRQFQDEMSIGKRIYPNLASSAIAESAFTSRPCNWYFVELIPDEFESYDDNTIPGVVDERIRVIAGEPCPKAGYYFTPAREKSRRHFEQGDIMPDFPNNWGTVIWQSTD